MAQPVTLGSMKTRARRGANMESSTFITDAELTDLFTEHTQDLYDKLVEASPPDYYSTEYTFSTVAGTLTYALPSDFRSLVMVYAPEQVNGMRPLAQLTDLQRVNYRAPQGAYSVMMRYTPVFPGYVDDSSTFDGISGWDNLIVSKVIRDLLMKEESDIAVIQNKINDIEQRLLSQASNRHQGMPRFISDYADIYSWPYPYTNVLSAYQLRGNGLDLYVISPVWP